MTLLQEFGIASLLRNGCKYFCLPTYIRTLSKVFYGMIKDLLFLAKNEILASS